MSWGLLSRVRRHRTVASVVALAVIAGVPTGFAVTHRGFPVSDVNLKSEDVWVTNGAKLLGGRLNHQIDQLDASVSGSSTDLDVLQNGAAYFLTDAARGSVQRIDPAYVSLTDQITVPDDSWVGYGGNTLAILSPDGKLWSIDTSNRLTFDATKMKPSAQLGRGAVAVVDHDGAVFATSPSTDALYTVSRPGATATKTKLAVQGTPQITAVGSTPVVLDKGGSRLRTPDKTLQLPAAGLQLQQPSAAAKDVLVSASDRLYRVPLGGGGATTIPAGGTSPSAVSASAVSAPVQLGGCDYAAWAASGRYLYACDGAKPISQAIGESVSGADLKFRVNHDVVALNNVQNGDAWVASRNLTLVRNWETLQPSNTEKKQSNKGQEQPVMLSYQQTLAKRTNTNHPPVAQADSFGVRPGRTTILPVLDNDQDPDGDVLTVKDTTPATLPTSEGILDLIQGGRALQFTPAPGASSASFRYTVTDGRGGEDSTSVQVAVHQPSVNAAPKPTRDSSVDVEQGQSISYNVLQDWIDPDGDAIFLENASPTSQDNVSFTPDGDITFDNTSNQVGNKTVEFTVSDGTAKATGKLTVTVKAKGTLDPVAVPDFAQATLGQATTIDPLANDQSPSGDPLELDGATSPNPALRVTVNREQGTLAVMGQATGTYYLTYQLGAGSHKPVDGLIRVDVTQPENTDAPPLAVSDLAYVHPGQTTTVTPLDNDVSPSGRVLAVQQVTGGADAGALNIQLLDNTEVKVTSPGVLEKQVQLGYIVSDGIKSATGTITVVPVAPLVNYQPPVAVTDAVNVRAGDIATVSVLDNDYSPDDQPFTLDPTLKSTAHAGGGTAFVSGSDVRYQAPSKPGQYSVTYQIDDDHSQSARASVLFNVIPSGSDQAPQPTTVTGRVFAGSTVPITIPLNGIDPDGDSVFFDGITDQPKLGKVSGVNATGFTYQAAASGAGTDEFHYQVEDAPGKTATGLIRIAVIPRPTTLQPPTAVNDQVQVKPGKTGAVQVLANDSDPNGYPLALDKKLDHIDPHLTDVTTDGSAVLFTAPQKEGVYTLHYTVSNGHGGTAGAYVQVTVSKNAKPRYPTATDHYLTAQQTKSKASVTIDALDGATNPSGPVADLTVQTTGANAKLARVDAVGKVVVDPQTSRTVIAYQVTDPTTKLTGKAFIVIPPRAITTSPAPNTDQNAVARKTTDAPRIKPGLGEQVVTENGSKSFTFGQILDVPSGRPATLAGAPTAAHGTVTGSGSSFTFTAAKDYRGPASVTFNVDDGKEDGATADRITTLTLPITVGAKDQSDVPPTFTPPKVQIEPGEAAKKIDLRAASYHPNQQILDSLTYTDLKSSNVNGVTAALSGSTLTVQAPVDEKPNTSAVFQFVVKSANFSIAGSVDVTVTSSTRPLAQQLNPPQTESLQRGHSVTLSGAVGTNYWSNPFPGTPLAITDSTVVSAPAGVTVTNTTDSITVTVASGAQPGAVNVTYHVQDATKDPARTAQVIGQLQVTIHDVPDAPPAPSNVTADQGTATMDITAPADNGLPITNYQVTSNNGGVWDTATPGALTVSGLTNGTSYTFTVQAYNSDGWSQASAPSAAVTPYGTPAAPASASLSPNEPYAKTKFTQTWPAVTDTGGGTVHYYWQLFKDGQLATTGTLTGTSRITTTSKKPGTWYYQVQAVSDATGRASAWTTSNSVTITDPPATLTLTRGQEAGPVGSCARSVCYYYELEADNFAQGDFTLMLSCGTATPPKSTTVQVTIKSSTWTYDSSGANGFFCHSQSGYATLNNITSNTVAFNP